MRGEGRRRHEHAFHGAASSGAVNEVPFREALLVWARIGLLSFGGPAGHIGLIHRVIVDEKRWLDEPRFMHALNYCMLLPGPEAQQLATYVGWLLHGVKGGVAAGVLFILPGAAAMLGLCWLYVSLGDLALISGLFLGLKAAVLVIVVQALVRIGRRTLQGTLRRSLAAAGFIALFVFDLPFPLVVLGAGLAGYLVARMPAHAAAAGMQQPAGEEPVVRPGTRRAAGLCLLLWMLTVGGLFAAAGPDNVFTQLAVFFSKMAMVTFGGAYAVLAYVAQQAVEHYHWLAPGEMLDGLALSETTPGPLILVTQFVGFLAAYREAASPGLLAATLGALLTTWVTFLPCFVWIFAGAPHVERMRANPALSAALGAITAAVVGVVANLALWFAVNSLFAEHHRVAGFGVDMQWPVPGSVQLPMLVMTVIACFCAFVLQFRLLPLLGTCAALGITWSLLVA